MTMNSNPLQGRDLLAPFCRVTIGQHKFCWGDGYLKEVSVSLNEGKDASTCSFSIYDPGKKYTDTYFKYAESVKGLTAVDTSPSTSPSTNTNTQSSTASGTLSVNMRAMLDTIAWAEGADYNIQFTGSKFTSYRDHPRQIKCSGGLCSDAAGRYQFLSTTWDSVAKDLGLKDFTPSNQDKAAVELIRRRGALQDVESGNVKAALEKISYEWASLPYE